MYWEAQRAFLRKKCLILFARVDKFPSPILYVTFLTTFATRAQLVIACGTLLNNEPCVQRSFIQIRSTFLNSSFVPRWPMFNLLKISMTFSFTTLQSFLFACAPDNDNLDNDNPKRVPILRPFRLNVWPRLHQDTHHRFVHLRDETVEFSGKAQYFPISP